MKVLIITNLYPNRKEPTRGIFNKQQFDELSKLCELKVVAPLPFFGFSLPDVPKREIIEGIDVYHPRYLVTPKILRSLYGFFFFSGVFGMVKKIYESFKFDVIFATWAYPDGFASSLIAGILKKPLIIKVHGTDVNVFTKYFFRRKMIMHGFKKAEKIITVNNALKQKIAGFGISPDKIEVISNAVDTDLFRPMDKVMCRKRLSIPSEKKVVLYVGNVERIKGVDILISAIQRIISKNMYLIIVGAGSLKDSLKARVGSLGLDKGVVFVGPWPHSEIPLWMNAADLFCLPSRNEGCPNVVLEALACGVSVVASKVGGLPEIINDGENGILVQAEDALALSKAIKKALSKKWDRDALARPVSSRTWGSNAERIADVLSSSRGHLSVPYCYHAVAYKRWIKEWLAAIVPKEWIIWNDERAQGLKRVALTFDDGPHPEYTPKVLDILKSFDVRASFFLLGKEVERSTDLAKRIVSEGHCVGNHSYSHNRFRYLSNKEMEKEISRTQDVFNDVFHRDNTLFRPPQGTLNLRCLKATRRLKLTMVLWSRELRNGDLDSVRTGDILLFHDDNGQILKTLPAVIEDLLDKDFEFVTIDEMLKVSYEYIISSPHTR